MNDVKQSLRRLTKGALLALTVVITTGSFTVSAGTAPEWQTLLERIININSGTQNAEGLDAVRDSCAAITRPCSSIRVTAC